MIFIVIFVAAVIYFFYREHRKTEDILEARRGEIDAFNQFLKPYKDSNSFKETKRFEFKDKVLCVDDERKLFAVNNGSKKIYNYSDLIDYEVEENGGTISSGSAGSALVGAALFGVTGAIVGSAGSTSNSPTITSLRVVLHLNDLDNPLFVFTFINFEIERNPVLGQKKRLMEALMSSVDNLVSLLSYVSNNKSQQEPHKQLDSNNDRNNDFKLRLRKLNELFEDGLISEEEYLKKKTSLLEEI